MGIVMTSAAAQSEIVAKIEALSVGQLFGYIAGILFVLSWIIQITPIKLNPWSAIARSIGRSLNKELRDIVSDGNHKMDKIERDLIALQQVVDEQNAKDARSKILEFGDALVHYVDREYSKDRYDDIMVCITEYTQYCEKHPEFKNHMTTATIRLIEERYDQCLRDGSFRIIGN